MLAAVTEQADRFALTTGRDGRILLSLVLRSHPWATATDYPRARRYWACAPGPRPRWLGGGSGSGYGRDDARHAEDAHAVAVAYVPGVSCSGCGDRRWRPVDREAVGRYVYGGVTGTCLTCREVPAEPAPPESRPPLVAEAFVGAPITVDAQPRDVIVRTAAAPGTDMVLRRASAAVVTAGRLPGVHRYLGHL